GAGNCLVWHLSYDGEISGLEAGANASDLVGCFSLSNSIEIIRTVEGDCQANGGMLFGGPFEFCAGDGIADMLEPGSITLTNSQGENSQWVITDDQGNILGLPPMPSVVDFDGAGSGTCLIWNLSYDGEITGLEMGANAGDLQGCFSLSNSIEVVRNQPEGGMLTGGPFEFCVGDGVADMISVDSITLEGNSGSNAQWVITDNEGNILGLPASFSDVDFDGAGVDTCLVWHLSFEDGLVGLEAGQNAADLEGCFSLSNPIIVNRIDCSAPSPGGFAPDQEIGFSVYPNPVNDRLRVDLDQKGEGEVTIRVMNAVGNLTIPEIRMDQQLEEKVLDLSSLQPGTYFIQVSGKNGRSIKQFVKF
ncbi:MAG: T9SS type A sorting domain-containing protein, partial [Bacteroidota bacterium]